MATNYKQDSDKIRSLRFVEFGLSVNVHIQNTVTCQIDRDVCVAPAARTFKYLFQVSTNNGIICFHIIKG
jgi:hypothetical protein